MKWRWFYYYFIWLCFLASKDHQKLKNPLENSMKTSNNHHATGKNNERLTFIITPITSHIPNHTNKLKCKRKSLEGGQIVALN